MTDVNAITYDSYLALDTVLSAQHPRSGAHDEPLFIIVHQASELWLKLCLHELSAARKLIRGDDVQPALKMLARVVRIQSLLAHSWEVLTTMTPSDYAAVRPHLGSSSGFQSVQYRALEFMLGERNRGLAARLPPSAPGHGELLEEARRPSLYDETLRLLARRGFPVPAAALTRDFGSPYQAHDGVEACWAAVYREPARHWQLYELAEKLVDLDCHVQHWRFGHMKTVERIIGFRRGTGGTSGVGYLKSVLEKTFFPELVSVRNAL